MKAMDGWPTYRLGDCIKLLSGGTPSKAKEAYWCGNIPWISNKDMKVTRIYESEDYLSDLGAKNGTHLVSVGTVLIVVRGMILAKKFPVAMAMRRVAFNQDLKAIECISHVIPQFLFYWLQGKEYEMLGLADEAAHGTKRIQTDRFLNYPIELPDPDIQRKIAAILSAYDDLIENNTRRIKILEEMAQALYREWFVNFRFPGHEKVRMVDSPLGEIPEGWKNQNLCDICSKLTDGTHDTPDPATEGFFLVTGRHIVNGFVDFTNCYCISPKEHEEVMKRSRPEKGDIIFSNIGTLGSTAIVDQDFEYSIKNVALLKPLKKIYSNFIYLYLSAPETLNMMSRRASGTSQKFFSLYFLRKSKLIVPTDEILSFFDNMIGSIIEQRSIIHKRNINLRRTRDLLLPKIISGELDVENLDINLGNLNT